MVHLANQIMSNNGSSLGHPPMASTSISSSLSVQEEEENHHHHQEQVQGEDHHNQRNVSSFRVNFTVNDWSSSEFMDDAWACLIMLVLCWFLGLYFFKYDFFFPFFSILFNSEIIDSLLRLFFRKFI